MTDAERYAISVRKVTIDDKELWRATVRELPDLAEFAETRDEALDLVADAIDSLKETAREDGRPFPEPIEDEEEYSGRVTLRMSKSMHRNVALRAIDEGVSLNALIIESIATGLVRPRDDAYVVSNTDLSFTRNYFASNWDDAISRAPGAVSMTGATVRIIDTYVSPDIEGPALSRPTHQVALAQASLRTEGRHASMRFASDRRR